MTTQNLALPLLAADQAQKHVTVNTALTALDRLVQLSVASRAMTAPPADVGDGDAHIVASPATGAWAGAEHRIAVHEGGEWAFHTPRAGWLAYVADEDAYFRYAGQWDRVAFVGGGQSS